MPVMAPALKAMARPAASPWRDASAVRTLARTETFMPMIAGGAGQHRADDEADGDVDAQGDAEDDQDDHADDADGGVLAVQVGPGAFLHGGGDLLHAGRAGVGGEHLRRGDQAVDQRQQTADDDQDLGQFASRVFPCWNLWGQAPDRLGRGRESARRYARRLQVRQITSGGRGLGRADLRAFRAGRGGWVVVRARDQAGPGRTTRRRTTTWRTTRRRMIRRRMIMRRTTRRGQGAARRRAGELTVPGVSPPACRRPRRPLHRSQS